MTSSMSEAELEKTDYTAMTKTQLQELLTQRDIEWTTSMLKAELVTLAEGSG